MVSMNYKPICYITYKGHFGEYIISENLSLYNICELKNIKSLKYLDLIKACSNNWKMLNSVTNSFPDFLCVPKAL